MYKSLEVSEVQKRLAELQAKSETDLDVAERHALGYLNTRGVTTLSEVINFQGPEKWAVWCAESIVWSARRARGKEWREFVRGMIQIAEYKGHNGGRLPYQLNDDISILSNYLQDVVSGRKS
jgi:hypothetical protein